MNLVNFKESLRGKHVIVVGNSLSSLEQKNGDLIDSYDRIVRFGAGIPNEVTSEYVGGFTHAWVSGKVRLDLIKTLRKGVQVLYNPSDASSRKWGPMPEGIRKLLEGKEYIQLYNNRILDDLKKRFNIHEDRRLSAGAIAAHFLVYKCKGYKSITFINFDNFKNGFIFYNEPAKSNSIASSYHLPLLTSEAIPEDLNNIPLGSPAHDCNGEVRLFQSLLKYKKVHWIGEPPSESAPNKILENANVRWTRGRRKKKRARNDWDNF